MSDAAAGATADLLSPPNGPAEQARTQIESLKQDASWVKRHLSGDHETRNELARLHELAYAPAQGSITMGGPTPEAQRAEMADHLGTLSDLPPDVLTHVRTGGSVTADEYRMAVAKKDALFSDAEWRAKYLAGNHEAKKQKLLLDVILSSSIKLVA
jgi:hypothetical protein